MKNLITVTIASTMLMFCGSQTLLAKELQQNNIEPLIAKTILSNQSNAIKLLKKVVNINSGTMNFSGVKKVADIFAKEFQLLGFETQWVSAIKYNRSGHLVASYGNTGPKLLLIGHLDTVFAANGPFQKLQQLSESKIKGPGISDMKGGNVIILESLRALKKASVLDKFQIKVILMGDEESRGRPVNQAAKILIDAGKWADVAMGFEDGDSDPKTAVISRRGASSWHLTVTANAAHSSQIFQPDVGYGAIYETARILQGFRTELAKLKLLTYSPGLILGGSAAEYQAQSSNGTAFGKSNVVAKITEVTGDLRAISPKQLQTARKIIQKIVADNLNGTHAKIIFDNGYPPMAPSKGNKKLLRLYSLISIDHGFGKVIAVDPRNAGAADISFVANDVDMAIDGLGLMGEGGHTRNETADMKTFTQQSIKASVLMYRLLEIYNPRTVNP